MSGRRFYFAIPIASILLLGIFLLFERLIFQDNFVDNEYPSGLIEIEPASITLCVGLNCEIEKGNFQSLKQGELYPPYLTPIMESFPDHYSSIREPKEYKPDVKIPSPEFDFKSQTMTIKGLEAPNGVDGRATLMMYPDQCIELKKQGSVIIEFDINKQGNVLSPRIISSPHDCFNKAVIGQIQSWVYPPTDKIIYNYRVSVSFVLAE